MEKHAAGLALQSTSLELLHPHSRWRDLPRVWWVERVADTMENRVHERRGGHRYQGRRRVSLGVAEQVRPGRAERTAK